MKKSRLLATLFITCFFNATASNAVDHSAHGGGGGAGGSSGSSARSCEKARLGKFMPAHLETVMPGAEFSFFAYNIDNPQQISVTVKNEPVAITSEFIDPYYLIKAKLPAALVNTAASRRNPGQISSCSSSPGHQDRQKQGRKLVIPNPDR